MGAINFCNEITIPAIPITRAFVGVDGHAFPCTGKTQTAQAWGTGTSGQIMVPGGLNNVAAVSAGWDFSAVLRTDGSALAWGKNDYGQATVRRPV